MIHVLAEAATLAATSDQPGYLRGLWDPARRIGARAGRHGQQTQAGEDPDRPARSGVPTLGASPASSSSGGI